MSVHFNPAQNSTVNAQKFGGQKQANAPKFGFIDGGVVSCPAIACACCAAPVAIPLLLVAGFFLLKGVRGIFKGVGGMFSGAVNAAKNLGGKAQQPTG